MDFGCRRTNHRFLSVLYSSAILLLLIINCAEVGPPPGGPEDKAPPFIIGSEPVNGSTDVARSDHVVLYFSESIVKPEGKKAVYISPRFAEEPELKWKSDRLIINFPDSFEVDQTYIISLSTDITDRRKNRLDSLTSMAFSTGTIIDSGGISGQVFSDEKPAAGVLVALYDVAVLEADHPFDSVYGQYITQTSSSGQFTFSYLPDREFCLVAFQDRNRDEMFSYGTEVFAVPDRPTVVNGILPLDELRMVLTQQDTAAAAIKAASYSAEGMLRMRISRPIDPAQLMADPSRVKVRSTVDTTVTFLGQAIVDSAGESTSSVVAYIGRLDEGVYSVTMNYDSLVSPLGFDSLRVRGDEDKEPPQMVFEPGRHPQFLDELAMRATFSEPLDTTALTEETFQLFDEQGAQLALSWRWQDPLKLVFESTDIRAGGKYRMSVTEFQVMDLAGTVMGDSLRELAFSTIDPDSVGAIMGQVEIELPGKTHDPVVLEFVKVSSKQTFVLPVRSRDYKIEVPAGKYMASGFIDSDKDGAIGRGSAVPYKLSETVMNYPDTITVRARFETADVNIVFR